MMNVIGKGMVLVHTVFSLVGLGLALLVYFDYVDWGRSEPRVVRGEAGKSGSDTRVASEFDKSKAALTLAASGRDLVLPPLGPAEDALRETELRFAQNRRFYVTVLKPLRDGVGDIEVMALPPDGVPTDTPGKAIGKPVPNVKVDGIDKSLATYTQMLKEEQKKLDPLRDMIEKLSEDNSQISYNLTGKDAAGKKVTHGLFELLDLEFLIQRQMMAEIEYTRPRWASAVAEARRFSDRRVTLETTLKGLEAAIQALKAKQK